MRCKRHTTVTGPRVAIDNSEDDKENHSGLCGFIPVATSFKRPSLRAFNPVGIHKQSYKSC